MSVFVFAPFLISRSLSERTSVKHVFLRNNVTVLVLMTFIGNVNKRRYLKIYSLKFDVQTLKQSYEKFLTVKL